MNSINKKQIPPGKSRAILLKGEQKLQSATGKIFSIFLKNG